MSIPISRGPLRRLGIVAALAVAFGTAFATPALAHTRLISSTPGKDASASGVTEVKLVFNENISVADVVVRDDKNKAYQSGKAERSGPTVTQKLTGALPAGNYTVGYGVVGKDGHRIQSQDVTFTVTGGGGDAGAPAGAPEGRPTAGGVGAAEQTGAAATSNEKPLKEDQEQAEAAKDSGSGTVMWVLIGAGVLIGIGIGVAIVFRAKRKAPVAGSTEKTPVASGSE